MPASLTGSKRAKGTGSVRQRRRGVWQVRWETGGGRNRQYHSETVRGTKTEAEAALRDRLTERERMRGLGVLSTDPKLTVEQWLRHWLYHVAKEQIRPTTFGCYRSMVERWLIPCLGPIRLSKLGVAEVQAYVSEQSDRPHSVRHQRAILRVALAEAKRQGLVRDNVAQLVRMPPIPRKEVQPLTPAQARAFLAAIADDRLSAMYQVVMALGLRQGELLGLTWEDIDLEAGTLRVRCGLKRYDGAYHLDEPKTARSIRVLSLPAPLVAALRTHRDRQRFERQTAGASWRGNDWNLVFTRPNGSPLHGTAVTKRFQQQLRRTGLPQVRFHDLRHGAATYLLSAGVPMRAVMDILGHTQMSTTSDLYSHVLPEMRKDASEKVAAVLFG